MIRFFLFGLVCFLAAPVSAQLNQIQRLELATIPNSDEDFDVLPLAERGLLVTIQRTESYAQQPHVFEFQKYSTALKRLWTTIYKQDIKYEPVLSYHNDQYLFYLYREPTSEGIQVLRVNLDDGLIETFDGHLLSLMDIVQFKVMGNTAYIGGYYHSRPVVMSFSFFDRSVKVLQGLYVNHLELNSLEIDELRKEVHVLVHSTRRRCSFAIRSYAPDGKLLRTLDFGGAQYSLISGKILPVSEQESLLIGNYSTDCTPYSQGIYVTRIHHTDSGKIPMGEIAIPTKKGVVTPPEAEHSDAIRYIEFSELTNFFNYLKPRRQQRILAKVLKKKDQGKDYKFRYRLLVHELLPTRTGLTLLAEVYYPQYRGTSLPAYNGMTRSERYLDGYHYTHAFVCGFDKAGNLLWDNCLAIKDLNNPVLQEMVQLFPQGEQMVLAYPQDGGVTVAVIDGNKVVRTDESYKLKPSSEQERVVESEKETLLAWYGQTFLASGFQKIAAEKGYGTPSREVFYINKLTYSPAPPGEVKAQK